MNTQKKTPKMTKKEVIFKSKQLKEKFPNKSFKFCKPKVDLLGPWQSGDLTYSDLFREILRFEEKGFFIYALFEKAALLLQLASACKFTGIHRFAYLHTLVCLLNLMDGEVETGNFSVIKDKFLILLQQAADAREYNRTSRIQNFSCVLSLASHHLRDGVRAQLTVAEFNEMPKYFVNVPKTVMPKTHPNEPTKYKQVRYGLKKIRGKMQPADRVWTLYSKDVNNGYETCSIKPFH